MFRGLTSQVRAAFVSALILAAGATQSACAQVLADEGFTYQGRLSQDGSLATGAFDIQFQLFDDAVAGTLLATFDAADLNVANGLFQTKVFFGKKISTRDKRWMQVLVRPGASVGAFTPLGARQELNAVPFAVNVLNVPTLQDCFDHSSFPSIVTTDGAFSIVPPSSTHVALQVTRGLASFGTSHAAPGAIEMRNATDTAKFTGLLGTFTNGAGVGDGLALWDVTGTSTLDATRAYAFIGPGPQANGGRLMLARDQNGITGIELLGNLASGNPKLSMLGANGQSAIIDLGASAPNRVILPTDSIQSEEISDEPGVTSANLTGSSAVGTTVATVRSSTITAPDNGFVMVFASAKASIVHVTGTNTSVTYGVSNIVGGLPGSQLLVAQIPASAPTGTYVIPISTHAVFPIAPGTTTFLLNALRAGAAGSSVGIAQSTISCLYVPTSYGTVTAPLPPPGGPSFTMAPPMSIDDIRREQSNSIAANDQRIADELAAMRQRCDKLEAELRQRPAAVLTTGAVNAQQEGK